MGKIYAFKHAYNMHCWSMQMCREIYCIFHSNCVLFLFLFFLLMSLETTGSKVATGFESYLSSVVLQQSNKDPFTFTYYKFITITAESNVYWFIPSLLKKKKREKKKKKKPAPAQLHLRTSCYWRKISVSFSVNSVVTQRLDGLSPQEM